MAKIVKMTRKEPQYEGGPTSADVCEAAVGDFLADGWVLAEGKPEPKVEPKVEPKAEPKAETTKPLDEPKKNIKKGK